jgi:hypothetical protein
LASACRHGSLRSPRERLLSCYRCPDLRSRSGRFTEDSAAPAPGAPRGGT